MKKIYCFIALLAGLAAFTACSDDDATYNPTPALEVSDVNVLFEAEGGSGTITVTTTGTVTATTESTWLTLSVSGNQVTATAPLNISLDGRSAKITLKANGAEAVVTATQKGSIYGLGDGNEYVVADTENASVSIPVVHTSADVIVTSLTEWLTASYNSSASEITVVAQSNDAEVERYGFVALQTGTVKDTLVIKQNAMVFNLGKTSIALPNSGGVETVDIEHSKPVTVESSAEWIECDWDDAKGVLTVTVSQNLGLARQGTITAKSLTSEKVITVIQYDPASLADQMLGDYYLTYYNDDGNLRYFDATLTEDALLIPDLEWSIPATVDKENLKISVNSGSYVGRYSSYFIYLLFIDETDQYWTGNDTESVVSATLGLDDFFGDGNLTLVGDFGGTYGQYEDVFGSFYFAAFSEQSLTLVSVNQGGPYLGGLLQMYAPGLIKVPAEGDAAPRKAMHKASQQKLNTVPKYLRRR